MAKDRKLFYLYSVLVFALIATAVIAPYFAPYDPYTSSMQPSLLPPSSEHLFGTDKLGRDSFTRILYGMRISIAMALGIVFIMSVVGTLIGIIAGFTGGKVDTLLMRFTDMVLAFPGIVLAIAIAGMLGGSIANTILALSAVGWTRYARLARSLVLKIRHSDFVTAAELTGARPGRLIRRYLLPNALPTLVITAATDIGTMMLELAGLSFLGFGAQPPTPEWGLMLNEGRQFIQTAPWLMVYPGVAILVVVAVFNLWGDSLRDVMDPKKAN